jgi:hypothetical protein
MSGSIRRTERTPGRSVARRKSSSLFALPQGTARLGPGADLPGLRFLFFLFAGGMARMFGAIPESVLSQRECGLGATGKIPRSNSHE